VRQLLVPPLAALLAAAPAAAQLRPVGRATGGRVEVALGESRAVDVIHTSGESVRASQPLAARLSRGSRR
jgi:hypothetical protein